MAPPCTAAERQLTRLATLLAVVTILVYVLMIIMMVVEGGPSGIEILRHGGFLLVSTAVLGTGSMVLRGIRLLQVVESAPVAEPAPAPSHSG